MVFILAADGIDRDAVDAFRRYRFYLEAERDRFPPSAFSLATSDWYFDPRDHRCPHDAWLEWASLSETHDGAERVLGLRLRLRGAYHDGYIELHYARVFKYALTLDNGAQGHRDWRYDEFRLSERGHLLHEIEWSGQSGTGRWLVEASDIEFSWLPQV